MSFILILISIDDYFVVMQYFLTQRCMSGHKFPKLHLLWCCHPINNFLDLPLCAMTASTNQLTVFLKVLPIKHNL